MGRKHLHQWLHSELPEWVKSGLVTDPQAQAIRDRYPLPEAGTAWGTIIFSSIGAIIAGLGVILLFAYNWQAIPKFGKLGIVFGALAAVHGTGLRLFLASERYRALGEGLCLLGTMLFGAGIWLVAQIYHIEEHFPNAFLIWGLGALLLAWAMPSTPQAILATLLLSIWCGMERFAFQSPMYIAPVLIGVVLGLLAYSRRSVLLVAVLIPAFTTTTIFILPGLNHHEWLIFATLLNLGALWIALRFLVRIYGGFENAWGIFGFYGWTVFYLALFILCFPELNHHLLRWHDAVTAPVWIAWTTQLGVTLIAWGLVFYGRVIRRRGLTDTDPGFEIYAVPLIVVLAVCGSLLPDLFHGWGLSGPCNLLFLGLAVSMMARGCRQTLVGPAVVGSVLLVALIIARYFDLFHNLFLRGLMFVAIGGILFAEGFLYARVKKQKKVDP